MLSGNQRNVRSDNTEYQHIKDKIVSMVNDNLPFDLAFFNTLTIEKLRLKSEAGIDNGKTVIWWLTWAASKGRIEAFEMAWLKHNQAFVLEDFQAKSIADVDTGLTAMLLLAYATKTHPTPFKRIWQRWADQISDKDLQTKGLLGPAMNLSMISAMLRAAKENKIKRHIIEHILATLPNVCSNEELSCKPTTEPSIAEFIEQSIQEGCDWSVKIKRIMSARNAFFESVSNMTKSQYPTQSDFSNLKGLAKNAYSAGYLRAQDDADLIVGLISAGQKNDWTFVFWVLENTSNPFVINDNLYNLLSQFARQQANLLVIHKLNNNFGKNRQYDHDDFTQQFKELVKYKRFKPSASFVSHALIKKGPNNNILCATQFQFSSVPANTPMIMGLKSINEAPLTGIPFYEATAIDDTKMISTDIFNIELQTKVDASFVCEKFDLVFLAPQKGKEFGTNKDYDLGLFTSEPIEIFKPNATAFVDNMKPEDEELNEECPTSRGGERELSIIHIHMQKTYSNDKDQPKADSPQSKSASLFKEFYHFYKEFFTSNMSQIATNSYEAKWLFVPEMLHAIAKQFHRPSENHSDAHNLAIAPKWVNSLMMVIESALRWNVVHSPFAKFKLKTHFETFPMHPVLREGKIEATLTSGDTQLKISKNLVPYQKNPAFTRITDITQATFVLNSLLNGKTGLQVPLAPLPLDPQNTITRYYDNASREANKQTLASTPTRLVKLTKS